MSKPVPVGTRAEISETVEHKHTLTSHFPQLPPVYSTPDMIRLMETACFLALQPYAEGDEITVGTKIEVEHRAATPLGAKVTAEAIWSHSMAASIRCAFAPGMIVKRSVEA